MRRRHDLNRKDISTSFEKTTGELKGARLLRMLSRGNLFNSICIANVGIMRRDLSIDFAAALQQRQLMRNIMLRVAAESISTCLANAAPEIYLERQTIPLVPMLDIDLTR